MDAPRENLTRSVRFEIERADQTSDGLTLTGYAAMFDSPTRIDSWEGMFDEQIARGAFKKTLREKTPVLQFEHGRHPLIGSMPLGAIQSAREDDKGLHIEARLADNWLIQPVRDAIANGSIDGMSFRFSVVRDKWDPGPPGTKIAAGQVPMRTLQEVKLAEVSPVVFPAYDSTSVGVRSQQFVTELLADDVARVELARALIFGTPVPPEGERGEAEAPVEDAARTAGTSGDAPPQDQEPPQEGTPAPQSRSDRLKLVARLRGITHESTGGSASASEGSG